MLNTASMHYVRFPPRWRNVLVPLRPARSSATAVAMYSPSRPLPVAAQHALWLAARTFGGRVLPGPREVWQPALPDPVLAALVDEWGVLAGADVEAIAGYERTQPRRQAVVLMVCAGRRSMLVRVRRERASLVLERQISAAARERPELGFRVPAEVGAGERDGWHWVAYEAISTRPHRPVRRLRANLPADITALVETVLARPPGTPSQWRGCHGDLNPWNLRRARSTTWLIDWEDASYAPPGADELYFRVVTAALRSSSPDLALQGSFDEAISYWTERITTRSVMSAEAYLQPRMLTALGAVSVS